MGLMEKSSIIADEVDSQLSQAMESFIAVSGERAHPSML